MIKKCMILVVMQFLFILPTVYGCNLQGNIINFSGSSIGVVGKQHLHGQEYGDFTLNRKVPNPDTVISLSPSQAMSYQLIVDYGPYYSRIVLKRGVCSCVVTVNVSTGPAFLGKDTCSTSVVVPKTAECEGISSSPVAIHTRNISINSIPANCELP